MTGFRPAAACLLAEEKSCYLLPSFLFSLLKSASQPPCPNCKLLLLSDVWIFPCPVLSSRSRFALESSASLTDCLTDCWPCSSLGCSSAIVRQRQQRLEGWQLENLHNPSRWRRGPTKGGPKRPRKFSECFPSPPSLPRPSNPPFLPQHRRICIARMGAATHTLMPLVYEFVPN